MSFALTTEQVRNQTKTVTRRLGWKTAKPGTLLQPVVKGQGLKKGEKVEHVGGAIRIVDVGWERLGAMLHAPDYGQRECAREGFPHLTPVEFVSMFCAANRCDSEAVVTRIAFEYLPVESV